MTRERAFAKLPDMEIKAAVLYEPNQPLSVERLQLADPGPREVLVRIVGSGVCGSDLHAIDGELPIKLPSVLGHEAAGVVEAVGADVQRIAPGDHVVLAWTPGCGRCPTCWNGEPRDCQHLLAGVDDLDDGQTRLSNNGVAIHHMSHIAGFAEYAVVGERTCVKVRKDAPLEKICLVGCCVATGYGAVFGNAKVEPGSSAVVIGCGGVGLNVIQALDLALATTIIAVDLVDSKLDMAREFGATHTINASETDTVQAVRDIVGEAGADYAFEVISTARTVEQAFELTRHRGTLVVVGLPLPWNATISIPASPFKTVTSGHPTGTQWQNTSLLVDLYMAGKLKLDQLISRERRLDDVNAAFDELRTGAIARTVLLPTS